MAKAKGVVIADFVCQDDMMLVSMELERCATSPLSPLSTLSLDQMRSPSPLALSPDCTPTLHPTDACGRGSGHGLVSPYI
jgi:hypothetical protein